jgi:hypothetical protein
MKRSAGMKRKFCVLVNEGSFFYDPWLVCDGDEGLLYWHVEDVPLPVVLEYTEELRRRREGSPHDFRMVLDILQHLCKKEKG